MAGEKETDWDLIIIGGGTGGLEAALLAAGKGLKTLVFEPGALAGTCLNIGCIPTKAMLHASSLALRIRELSTDVGVKVPAISWNYKKLMAWVKGIVDSEQAHIAKLIQNRNLTIIREHARFVGPRLVEAGGVRYTGKNIIISTGAKPRIPAIKGLNGVTFRTSDDIFKIDKQPAEVILIGGGYIAMEFAVFFNEIGSKVTIVERMGTVLGDIDKEVSASLIEYYADKGIVIKLNAETLEVKEMKGKKLLAVSEGGKKPVSLSCDELFVMTGRVPNTFNLGLDLAGVQKGERGNIIVDSNLQTSAKGVYALGDVTGRAFFANLAQREAELLAEYFATGTKKKIDLDLIPWSSFLHPPLAVVGLTEKQAFDKKIDYGVLKVDFRRSGKGVIFKERKGFIKVIYDKKTRKLIGTIILGQGAEELIHLFLVFMHSESTIDLLDEMMYIHPSWTEAILHLKEYPKSYP